MPFLPEKEHCQVTGQVRGSNRTAMVRDYTAIITHNLARTEERPGTGQAIPSVLAAVKMGQAEKCDFSILNFKWV